MYRGLRKNHNKGRLKEFFSKGFSSVSSAMLEFTDLLYLFRLL